MESDQYFRPTGVEWHLPSKYDGPLFGRKGFLAKQETMGTQGKPQGKTVAKTVHFFILLNKGLQICFLHLRNIGSGFTSHGLTIIKVVGK